MEESTKRKAEDELTEVANELVKRNKNSTSSNDLAAKSESDAVQIHELSKSKSRSRSVSPAVDRNDEPAASEEAPPEVFADVRLEVPDKNTQIWLESKQNMRFFKEEYGVNLLRVGTPLSDTETKTEGQLDEKMMGQGDHLSDTGHKAEQTGDTQESM